MNTETAHTYGPFEISIIGEEYWVTHESGTRERLQLLQYQLLLALIEAKGDTARHEAIYQTMYATRNHLAEYGIIKAHVTRLRKAFNRLTENGEQCIVTVFGIGYYLSATPVAPVHRMVAGERRELNLLRKHASATDGITTVSGRIERVQNRMADAHPRA